MGKTPDIMILWHFLSIVFPGNMEYYWGGPAHFPVHPSLGMED
jgi:hypothetical protein